MSILIKDMKMPESCSRCLLMVGTFCDVLETDVDPFYDGANKRHASCPLVGLPEKHGRLVDADELKTAFPTCDNHMDIKIASVRATVNHAPTIIEAEGDDR